MAGFLLAGCLPCAAAAEARSDAGATLDLAIAAAEKSLREGEPESAESHYRSALQHGWLLMGELEEANGRLAEAREAFRAASTCAADDRRALQSLAQVDLQMGEPDQAVPVLTRLAGKDRADVPTRRLLAQALAASGRPEQAVQSLEEAFALAPDDLELAYSLATGYLRVKKAEAAEGLFAAIVRQRPIPQTHVLIGRAYREVGEYARARSELRAALKQDPRARRAHYYLGLVILDDEGTGLDELTKAIVELQEELKLAPLDPQTNLQMGMALVEARRFEEALPALDVATRSDPPEARAFYYRGRCQLGLDQLAAAVDSLRRALELARQQGASETQLVSLHNHLGQALKRVGAPEEAETHFAEAKSMAARGIESSRARMSRYLADAADPERAASTVPLAIDSHPLADLPPPERLELKRRATAALARAYFNLGVLQAQRERFARAAELFGRAAAVDADFPQVQSSLGVAHFNAQQFAEAKGPLARASAANPGDAGLRRVLAMSHVNTQSYDQAAVLLEADPERATNPSLEFTYGLALVRSKRPAEAEAVFRGLLTRHGDWAEMSVLLGQAHADQGKYDEAVESLKRALQLKADVAEANGTLGVIYLQQGRLAEAEEAFRAELKARPEDVQTRHNLAVVLDSEQRPDDALPLLRTVLKTKPEFADARYLLGKILLAQGAATEALAHLEAAARLAPEDANIHYQLGRAYQKLGQATLAGEQFELFRRLKAER